MEVRPFIEAAEAAATDTPVHCERWNDRRTESRWERRAVGSGGDAPELEFAAASGATTVGFASSAPVVASSSVSVVPWLQNELGSTHVPNSRTPPGGTRRGPHGGAGNVAKLNGAQEPLYTPWYKVEARASLLVLLRELLASPASVRVHVC